jgi:RimJ/RimL family protein N-acetyltransferase
MDLEDTRPNKRLQLIQFPVAPLLPDDVLERARQLPTKPAPVTLTGRYVRLQPLDLARDVEPLFAVSNGSPATLGERSIGAYDADELIWRYLFAGPFADTEALAAHLRPQVEANNGLCLCVFDVATGRQVGVLNYMNNFPEHLKIELGSIWYSPLVQRTNANLEATYLTLKHAFELGYRRLEWKCNALNERSRRAALRMGFQFEGIQEAHMIIKGRNRDTAWYRLLDGEWAQVKPHLEGMLYS